MAEPMLAIGACRSHVHSVGTPSGSSVNVSMPHEKAQAVQTAYRKVREFTSEGYHTRRTFVSCFTASGRA